MREARPAALFALHGLRDLTHPSIAPALAPGSRLPGDCFHIAGRLMDVLAGLESTGSPWWDAEVSALVTFLHWKMWKKAAARLLTRIEQKGTPRCSDVSF